MQNDDDTWIEVFRAIFNPNALQATVFGLTAGKLYSFRVYAVDFNGDSNPSDVYQIYACGLPRYFDAPRYLQSTQTSITIQWDEPKFDGGCPILDYEVYRDLDGTGKNWTVVNPKDSYPRMDSNIRKFTCDRFPQLVSVGDEFVFKVVAINIQGSVESFTSSLMYLASVPNKPASPPTSDVLVTSRTSIKVTY